MAGRPISQWTGREIADELKKRGIVTQISATTRRSAPQKGGFQPHRFRYWLTEEPDERREEKIVEGCEVYAKAAERTKQGERTAESRLQRPGCKPSSENIPICRRFRVMFCGASSNIFDMKPCPGSSNSDVVSGHVIEPSWGTTRTEEDGLAHLQHLIASDPHATKWHIVLDNLNIHQSEALGPLDR